MSGVTLSVEKGEFRIIVSSFGTGKIAILDLLGGMDGYTSGTIFLDGQCISIARTLAKKTKQLLCDEPPVLWTMSPVKTS